MLDDPPDVIAECSVSSVDVHANDRSPTTVLGICPTLLTPQSKISASAVLQVVEKKLKHPPKRSKYGGDHKKKVKQVWRATNHPMGYG